MRQQRPVRGHGLPFGIASSNSGKKLALEPTTVLV